MNHKMLYPIAGALALLGVLFVTLGSGAPVIAQEPTPGGDDILMEVAIPEELPPGVPLPGQIITRTLEGSPDNPREPGGTAELLPGVWITETVDSGGDVGDQCSLELDAAGYPHISYNDRTNDALKYAFQDAAGWHLETVDAQGGSDSKLQLDDQGYAHILYKSGGTTKYTYEDLSGWHFETVNGVGTSVSFALDHNGNPHIAYIVITTAPQLIVNYSLYYSFRSNNTWNPQVLDTASQQYFGQNPGTYMGNGTSIAIGTDGFPRITYAKGSINERYSSMSLRYAVFNGTTWSKSTLRSGSCYRYLEGPYYCYQVGAYSALRLSALGAARVSYYVYWYSNSPSTPSGEYLGYYADSHSYAVDQTVVDKASSLALDHSENAYISYFDKLSMDLRFAYHDSDGWQRQVIHSRGEVGRCSSIEVVSEGEPIISYYDATNGDLMLARYDTHGAFLRPRVQNKSGGRGTTISYQLKLDNRTGADDSFTLELGPHTWQTLPTVSPIGPVPDGGSIQVDLTVLVPGDAPWYAANSVDVIARSQNDPTQTTNITRLTTQAYAPPQLSLQPEVLESVQLPGQHVTQTLYIYNSNGVTLTYRLTKPTSPSMDIGLLVHMEDPVDATVIEDSSFYHVPLDCNDAEGDCPIRGVPGVSGYGFEFTPNENIIHGIDVPSLNPTQTIAISTWINPSEWSDKFIISKGQWWEQYKLYEQPGELRLRLWGVGEVSAPAPSLNEWHHVVGQYNGNQMQIWIDGALGGELAATGVINICGNHLKIGALDNADTGHINHYQGKMDELAIFSRALTPSEIQEINRTHSYLHIFEWVSVSPITGTVQTNQTQSLQVVFDSSWKQPGIYTQNLYLDTNDPEHGYVIIPVRMEVIELPDRFYLPILTR